MKQFKIRGVVQHSPSLYVLHATTIEAESAEQALESWTNDVGEVDHVLSAAERIDLVPTLQASGLLDIVEL